MLMGPALDFDQSIPFNSLLSRLFLLQAEELSRLFGCVTLRACKSLNHCQNGGDLLPTSCASLHLFLQAFQPKSLWFWAKKCLQILDIFRNYPSTTMKDRHSLKTRAAHLTAETYAGPSDVKARSRGSEHCKNVKRIGEATASSSNVADAVRCRILLPVMVSTAKPKERPGFAISPSINYLSSKQAVSGMDYLRGGNAGGPVASDTRSRYICKISAFKSLPTAENGKDCWIVKLLMESTNDLECTSHLITTIQKRSDLLHRLPKDSNVTPDAIISPTWIVEKAVTKLITRNILYKEVKDAPEKTRPKWMMVTRVRWTVYAIRPEI